MKYLTNVTTLQYLPEKCVGCGRCVEVCPQGVFEMREKRGQSRTATSAWNAGPTRNTAISVRFRSMQVRATLRPSLPACLRGANRHADAAILLLEAASLSGWQM
ncbi:MAG TPA: ferredoxin family protein [Nitrospirota bacterium]|nr:ferredoxin family protein [Nitrospirota bacterium]